MGPLGHSGFWCWGSCREMCKRGYTTREGIESVLCYMSHCCLAYMAAASPQGTARTLVAHKNPPWHANVNASNNATALTGCVTAGPEQAQTRRKSASHGRTGWVQPSERPISLCTVSSAAGKPCTVLHAAARDISQRVSGKSRPKLANTGTCAQHEAAHCQLSYHNPGSTRCQNNTGGESDCTVHEQSNRASPSKTQLQDIAQHRSTEGAAYSDSAFSKP